MIRDPGPIHNLGYSVTSRDIPMMDGEERGDSPNSGFIAKALNGHPVLRFIGVAGASIATMTVLSRMTKSGGLKLTKYLQDSAEAAQEIGQNNLTTRLYSSLKSARRELDELAGLNRTIDGVDANQIDPYSQLVYDRAGKLTTGDVRLTSRGTHFRGGELNQAGRGITSEPAAVWNYRDEVQSRMVRLARRLPYELPALYVGQKAVVDPIFGNESQKSKVKWYNPVDVITDFVKTSTINTATMLMPFEAGGAAINSAKSSLHTFRYSMGDLSRLMPSGQLSPSQKMFVNLSDLTAAVGHDLGRLTNSILKFSTQSSGAIQAATKNYSADRPSITQSMHRARNTSAIERYRTSAETSKIKKATTFVKDLVFGNSSSSNYGAIDIFPGIRGVNASIRQGINEFKLLGQSYDVVSGAVAFDRQLLSMRGANAAQELRSGIGRVQDMRLDRMTRLANKISVTGTGRTGQDRFTTSEFHKMFTKNEYKNLLEKQILEKSGGQAGSDEFRQNLRLFIDNINVEPKITNSARSITIGDLKLIREGDDAYNAIMKRFSTIAGEDAMANIFSTRALDEAIKNTNRIFSSREFRKNLDITIKKGFDAQLDISAVRAGEKILKPKKANYDNFLRISGPDSTEYEFLVKKTAETLGVSLKDANGRAISTSVVADKLKAFDLDAQDYGSLRSFLVRNKKMTTGIFPGGYNVFGLKQLTIDEAVGRGMYSHLGQDKQDIIRTMAAKIAARDPIASRESVSALSGMYTTASGLNIDLSALKTIGSSIGNFLAKDIKIPIVNFNPVTLFGKGSFDEMSGRVPYQIVAGRTVQPFLPEGTQRADFYTFISGGKTKGQVIGYTRDPVSGIYSSQELAGLYRPIVSSSNEMLARNARIAAARKVKGNNLLNFDNETFKPSPLLSRLGFSDESQRTFGRRVAKFKDDFNFTVDQPESIPRLIGRFKNRSTDIYNPNVINRLIEGQTIATKSGKMRMNIVQGEDDLIRSANIVDDVTGAEMVSQADLLKAFEANRKRIYGYGFNQKVMQGMQRLQSLSGVYDDIFGPNATLTEKVSVANRLINTVNTDARAISALGFDSQAYRQSTNTLRKILEESDLLSGTQIKGRSPSIVTREDLLTNEIFKQLTLRQSLLGGNRDEIFQELQKVISQSGLSSGQLAEAQAAASGILYKLSSFSANRSSLSELQVQLRALNNVNAQYTSSGVMGEAAKYFNQPFITGSINRVQNDRFGVVRDFVYKRFSASPYQISDLATDSLGSARGPGMDVTLVPTFGTVFARNPVQASLSVAGVNTYSNTQAYSSASVPISHGIERLNRYFGAAGMKVDPTQYSGPLSLFANGMIGRRVLPLFAAGTAYMTADRTLGGFVNEKDSRGERIYSPLLLGGVARGVVEAQAFGAGLIPGGMSYQEKREQLVDGEVPIRQGRFWPLGNTPFQGGKVMYYRPSWYRKLQGGAMFTSDTYGSPMEKALFYTDISPLRPLDPYRFERKHYEDRPYPVSGEYFSGPFGPMVPILNATVGKILKPQVLMHEQELNQGLASYVPAGQSGAYNAQPYAAAGITYSSSGVPNQQFGLMRGGSFGSYSNYISASNTRAASAAGSLNTASNLVSSLISSANSSYTSAAYSPYGGTSFSNPVQFGPPKVSGVMPQRIVPSGVPLSPDMANIQLGEIGYRMQETLGIYGFGLSTLREKFGFGQGDFEPQRSVLQSASKAYGTSRQFWDLNLGGLGDLPLPGRSALSSIEFSEITRRFIPKDRTGVDYLNPIQNLMGQQYPFLPGSEYFTDFTRGDPFTRVQEGEVRLPGVAYERFNTLRSDETGRYGLLDQYKILGDVASYSKQFKLLDKQLSKSLTDPAEKMLFQDLQQRVAETQRKETFTDYQYKYSSPEEMNMNPTEFNIRRIGESLVHKDNIINTKILNKHTAVEDWEKNNVYGSTFPEWQRPFESFIEPMFYKASNRDPLTAASAMGIAGSFFGATQRGKGIMSISGALAGLVTSSYQNAKEIITGEEFMPLTRKKELALEEYTDILSYVKNKRLSSMAYAAGDGAAANQFRMASERTMYGANLNNPDLETLSLAIPKRKREHFKAMINAPVEERERILKTAPRLERRFYQAAWGMAVEQRPELDEYFAQHELPDADWEGWHPNTNMEHVKIKMGQSMGLEMSQMGYYPQQIREANLSNPSYPNFGFESQVSNIDRIRALISRIGINGNVSAINNYSGSDNYNILAGVR